VGTPVGEQVRLGPVEEAESNRRPGTEPEAAIRKTKAWPPKTAVGQCPADENIGRPVPSD